MKAVIFTHFHNRTVDNIKKKTSEQEQQLGAKEENEIIESVLSYYKAYLKCKNISIIYVYVDTGIKQILESIVTQEGKINIDIHELAFEHTIRNILKLAVDRAIRELPEGDYDPATSPKFQFIGLPHMAALIASLYRMDKDLVINLAGKGQFTYDAPKFVEAVIRLARGQDDLLRVDPILRFDQDVEVNEASIEILLNKIMNARILKYAYSFFSGGYGTLQGVRDPVNDYALRCHWLADIENYPNESPYRLVPNGEFFLRDIGEFGATSISNSSKATPSKAMKDYYANRGGSTNRDSQQVISGAGLYMSLSAIRRLPPFMNFEKNIIWVDDHLKRKLHEVLDDLAPNDLEHVDGCLFHQERYPSPPGIQPSDINWAKDTYFYRLIGGCIMHALIVTRSGKRGELANFVYNFLHCYRPQENEGAFIQLSEKFMEVANDTVRDLLAIWSVADYGDDTLKNWAIDKQKELCTGSGLLTDWINSTVNDAINYCKLVEKWNKYVLAIQDLVAHDAYWLFRS